MSNPMMELINQINHDYFEVNGLPTVVPRASRDAARVAACEELLHKWRVDSADRTIDRACRQMYAECADELETALDASA